MMMSKKKTIGTLLAGVAIGAGLGVLFAPKKGSETRRELKEKMDDLINKAKQIDAKEVKENIENKIEEIKSELKDLDKEKVLKIAKSKATKIQKKAEELYNLAVEKGTPVLEKSVAELKQATADTLKKIVAKLEAEEK